MLYKVLGYLVFACNTCIFKLLSQNEKNNNYEKNEQPKIYKTQNVNSCMFYCALNLSILKTKFNFIIDHLLCSSETN